jgi:hypothetical protein
MIGRWDRTATATERLLARTSSRHLFFWLLSVELMARCLSPEGVCCGVLFITTTVCVVMEGTEKGRDGESWKGMFAAADV